MFSENNNTHLSIEYLTLKDIVFNAIAKAKELSAGKNYHDSARANLPI